MTDKKETDSNHGTADSSKRTERFGDKTIGAGMTSPDSTEAVLDASTGNPDPRATQTKEEYEGKDAKPAPKKS